MHCRAYNLLERDFKELYDNNYEGITASPVSEDLMTWEAEIEGLQNSIWHGFISQLIIHFTPEYNLVPPVVKFITIPFHPNVDPYTSQPSVDFLDNCDKWNTSYTLSSILLSLQVLLSNPVLDNPVNLEAAQLLIRDESMYRAVVQKLFQESSQRHGSPELSEDTHTHIRIIKTVSFNDYYKTWSGIATSKTTEHSRNPLLKDSKFMGQYYKWKRRDLQHPKQWKLKFGVTKCQLARENRLPHTASRFGKRMVVCSSPTEVSYESKIESDTGMYEAVQEEKDENLPEDYGSDESWENEVDNLVAWTNALDIDSLDYQD